MDNKLKIHFAPLQGYTDYVYRKAHHDIFGGVDFYYTPFVRIERNDFRQRELRDIKPENNQGIEVTPQLIASNGEELRRIAQLFIDNGYKKADINMGCPFPMIANHGKGSGLLAHPDKVKELLQAADQINGLEFSLKMRLGWDSADEAMALLPILNDSSLTHICLHPRLGKQQYKGEVDMTAFEAFYADCRKPLIYNGDILSVEQIKDIASRYPQLAGIMIGRGLLANPSLAHDYSTGEETSDEIMKKKVKALHAEVFAQYREYLQGDKQLLDKIKPFWEYLAPWIVKRLRKKIEKANKIDIYESAVAEAFSQWGKVSAAAEEETL